jgi:Na+-driven multidrug efflux pump
VQQSSLVLIILAASNLPALLDIGSRGLLVAMGHVRLTATLSIVEAFLNLSLSLIFVFDGWGLIGIAAGTLVSRIFMRFFVTIWFTCRRTGIKWKTFAWDICGRGTLAFIIFAGLSIWVRRQISSESWFLFFTQIIIVLVCYVPVAFWLLLPVDDRSVR